METKRLQAKEAGAIELAANYLQQGEIVIFPTDTLYGIGVDAFNAAAIDRLYQVKERSLDKGIPILLADPETVSHTAGRIPDLAQTLINQFWPGPLTLVLPRHPNLPANISPNEGIALRIPDNEVARQLIRRAGGAVAASSANLSGGAPAQTADEAFQVFAGRVAAVLDGGPAMHGVPSTVLDCTVSPPRILRAGPLSLEKLLAAA